MLTTMSNPCSVCGKERIVIKTIKEKIGNSLVVTKITSCPDPLCQARINIKLAKEEKFRKDLKLAGEKRIQEQKERRAEEASRKKKAN